MTKTRRASCRCGGLSVECEGEPIRVSVCHCFACQQRSGSPFGEQARFPADRVTIRGESTEWVRTADSGNPVAYHFCPICGSTVWYRGGPMPDAIAVPVGLFTDPEFPPPRFSVWESRSHPWIHLLGAEIEHHD
ncbi:GFA family protein [soil metagenome]